MDKGKIVNFEESAALDESNVVSLAGGSLGGKGKGPCICQYPYL